MIVSSAVLAQPQSPSLACPPPEPLRGPQAAALDRSGTLRVDAERFGADPDQRVRFEEQVSLEQDGQRLESELLIYDPASGRVSLPGRLAYSGPQLNMQADSAHYDVRGRSGSFSALSYAIPGTTARGAAANAWLFDPENARLDDFDFTTCPPEKVDWQLRATQVDMNFEKGVGVARNARLEFKGLPILYSPWLSFPLDGRRKTGFLYPGFGYSTDNGLDLSLPWYWNIAPNQDATLTARWIERRGAMLGLQHRFMTARQRGELNIDWLEHDRRADRSRYFAEFEYGFNLHPDWRARAHLQRASDDNYFSDLGSDLHGSAIQYLRSSASLRGGGRHWTLEMLADTFQVLDESVSPEREPYRRLPRVLLDYDRPLGGRFRMSLDAEAVYFDRDTGMTGARVDLLPRLHYDLVAPGWHVRPALGLRATGWNLNSLDSTDGPSDSSFDRGLPIATVDAGLAFERRLAGGRVQTLEPRAYYLYVPRRDQNDIPVFDTRDLTFGFSQLFHYNRFSGADRQGDANQLTLALSSRLLDASDGFNRLTASVGQIIYFSDRQVQLKNGSPERAGHSATVAEVQWRPAQQLALSAGLQWDSAENETEVGSFGLNWRGRDAREVALGYRYRRDRVSQADVRFRYPLRAGFNLVGRFTHSFEEDETLEVLGGIEYESCCWALRFTGREWVRDRRSDKRTAFFVEFELKGLGSLGRPPYPLFPDRPW